MATIKDRAGAFCARHSRRLAALQFTLLILVIAVASAASGWAWTRMMYVEHIGDMKLQSAAEIERIQTLYRERLAEKDEVIDRKDAQIDALTDKVSNIAGKTERAADTAKAAADKADKAVKQSAPRILPPQPAPDWLGGP